MQCALCFHAPKSKELQDFPFNVVIFKWTLSALLSRSYLRDTVVKKIELKIHLSGRKVSSKNHMSTYNSHLIVNIWIHHNSSRSKKSGKIFFPLKGMPRCLQLIRNSLISYLTFQSLRANRSWAPPSFACNRKNTDHLEKGWLWL